jgi:xanthine dehydrogenase YagS FAD-binding subunit
MEPFKFLRAESNTAALIAAHTHNTKYIAGGTNLIDLMKLNIETPGQLIDINRLPLNQIEELPNGIIRIGALVKNSDLAYHPVIKQRYPVLSEALLAGASPQLRNMASVGGNLMQRTRCPYFYNTGFPCNKRTPGSGCAAINGYNRGNAVLGTSDKCIATHPSDMCVALAALGAVIHAQGKDGTRIIPFGEFHLLPRQTPHVEHALKPGELITYVDIPSIPYGWRSRYLKVRDRQSYEFALVSVAVILNIKKGIITNAHIALGGVGTKPWRSFAAENVLTGSKASELNYKKAAEDALNQAKGYKDNSFKIELAKRTLIQALITTGAMS